MIAWIVQGGYTLPNREYYLNQDETSVEIRDRYLAHISRIFELAGVSRDMSDTAAADVLQFEAALARAAWDRVAGKTGLTQRLVHKKWKPSDASTSGAWATQLCLPQRDTADREIWLGILAGRRISD